MALIKWTKAQKVGPSSNNKNSHQTKKEAKKAAKLAKKARRMSGKHDSDFHPHSDKGEESGGGETSTSKDGKPKLRKSMLSMLRKSFIGTNELLHMTKSDNDEFYHERDVTEIQDPKYVPRWYAISPETNFRKTWDLVQAVALFYMALLVPTRVGYDVNVHGTAYAIDFSLEIYFILDFVLNFFTGYENTDDHGRIITMPSMIATNYAKAWLIIDLLGLLPVDLSLKISQGRFRCSFEADGCPDYEDNSAQLLKLFKLFRLFRLIKLLRLVRLNKLIERLEADSNSWVVKEFGEDFEDKSLVRKYIASMYWAFTTMTTVGYGDVSAQTRGERIFAILGMIMGAFVYSGIIGSIGSVITNMDLSQQAHRVKMDAVSTYVRERSLPKDLRKEMLLFFRVQKVSAYNESELLGEVPMDLRSAIIHYVYGRHMEKCSLIKKCSKHFLTEMFARMIPQTYISGTVIFRKGEFASQLFIIIKGKVEMLDPETNKSVITFPEGSYFGEKSIIPPFRHDETMRARTNCKLLSIAKEEFDFILDQYEYDKNIIRAQAMERHRKVREEFAKHLKENNKDYVLRQQSSANKFAKRFKRNSTVRRDLREKEEGETSAADNPADQDEGEAPPPSPKGPLSPSPHGSVEDRRRRSTEAAKRSTDAVMGVIVDKLDHLTRAIEELRDTVNSRAPGVAGE